MIIGNNSLISSSLDMAIDDGISLVYGSKVMQLGKMVARSNLNEEECTLNHLLKIESITRKDDLMLSISRVNEMTDEIISLVKKKRKQHKWRLKEF